MSDLRNTRQRLLEAAIEAIEAEGEVGVRVERIAAEAGVAKPSLYHFFHDREGLIVAAEAERFRRSIRYGAHALVERARVCTSREEYRDLVVTALSSFIDDDGRRRRRTRVEVLGSAVSRPELQRQIDLVIDEAVKELRMLIKVGHHHGWVTTEHYHEALAMFWVSLFTGRHFVDHRDPEIGAEWDAVAQSTVRHLLFGE